MPHFGPQGISNTMNALTRFRYFPGRHFLVAVIGRFGQCLHEANAQNVANLLHSLGQLKYHPGKKGGGGIRFMCWNFHVCFSRSLRQTRL